MTAFERLWGLIRFPAFCYPTEFSKDKYLIILKAKSFSVLIIWRRRVDELINSFIKCRIGIAPGAVATSSV